MSLTPSSGGPISCAEWDALVDVEGFLALGRNRYPCSYVIYTDGTNTYAENGTTGQLDYGGPTNEGGVSGTDAAAIIQATINALTTGGKICIRSGDYTINSRIIVTSGITIEGELGGYASGFTGTRLVLGNNVNTNMFYDNANANIRMITLRNMHLGGNSANQAVDADLIDFYTSSIHRLENLVVNDASRDGAYVRFTWVTNCMFRNCKRNGAFVGADGFTTNCNFDNNVKDVAYDTNFNAGLVGGGHVEGCKSYNQTHGSGFYSPGGHLYNNCIAEDNKYEGFFAQGSTGTIWYACASNSNDRHGFSFGHYTRGTMIGCTSINNAAGDGVLEYGTSDYNIIVNNIFNGNFNPVTYVGVNTTIMDNQGYNPVGIIANPFDTPNTNIETTGAAATPTAGVTYTIRNTDIKISSTDSGNTDCAIMLKDPSGNNVLQAALSSIESMYIPAGFQIEWGAFTGAAPTVTVAFN